MNITPQISVIIPVYNAEKYLSQCLESLLKQDFSNIEIICVNDGSTDSSLEILNEYADKDSRIKIINKENSGAGDSRNIGIEQAQGKYILVLDADDFFDSRMCSLAYEKAETDNADIVIYRYFYFDNISKSLKEQDYSWSPIKKIFSHSFSKKDIPYKIFNIFTNAPFTKLYKRDFIKRNEIKFDNLRCCNDMTFSLLSLYNAEKISLLDIPLVFYRVNTSTQISASRGKNSNCVFEALYSFMKQCLIEQEYVDSLYLYAVSIFSHEYKKAEEKEKFIQKVAEFLPPKYLQKFLYKIGKIPFYKKIFSYQADAANFYLYFLGIKFKFKSFYVRKK